MDILFQPMDFPPLESVMSKCLISLCHLMHVFFLLHGCSGIVHCIHQFVCQSLFHGLLASLTRILSQPAKSQRLTSVCSYLDRNLISSTTDTSCFYFQGRHDIVHCLLKYFKCWFA